jgi:hypothetical protein
VLCIAVLKKVFAFSGEFFHIPATEEGKKELCAPTLLTLLPKKHRQYFLRRPSGILRRFFISRLSFDAGKFTESSSSCNVVLTLSRYIRVLSTLPGRVRLMSG